MTGKGMGVAPDLARKILWRLLDGRDPVAIACEVPCGYADVAAVQASLDMVELAAECAADGSRVVIEAGDDAEAAALKTMARAAEGFGGARITVDGPAAVRFAAQAPVAATPTDDEQHTREERTARKASSTRGERGPVEPMVGAAGPDVGVQPAAPQRTGEASSGASPSSSHAKPEEAVSASAAAASAAGDAECRAARPAPGSLSPIASPIRTGSARRLPEDALRGAIAPPAPARGHAPQAGGSRAVILSTLPNAQFASLYLGRRYDLDGLTAAQAARLRGRRS